MRIDLISPYLLNLSPISSSLNSYGRFFTNSVLQSDGIDSANSANVSAISITYLCCLVSLASGDLVLPLYPGTFRPFSDH